MKRIMSILLTLTLIPGLILYNTITAYGVPGGTTKRLYGNDRFETSVAISQDGWPSSDYVIISTGEGDDKFADALAGAPIAKMYDAPMLLTNTDGINTEIVDEIKRLNAKSAIILGGASVVSADAEDQLRSMGLNVERLWGQDRYETAVKIAARLRTKYSFNKAFLTTGYEFQYALMAAPFASGIPILFSQSTSLTGSTRQAIADLGIKEVEVIGNSGVISEGVVNEIKNMGINVTRIDGCFYEEVNIGIVKKYNTSPSSMAVARIDLFADALSGASYALKKQAPIFLTASDHVVSSLKNFVHSLTTTGNYIFGGPGAISEDVVKELIPDTITVPPIQIIPGIKIPVQVTPIPVNPGLELVPGNTSSNISAAGLAAASGEWVYFRLQSGLYKSKMDGSSMIRLVDDSVLGINVWGDYIYYVNHSDNNHIYKLKTDNSVRLKLTDDSANYDLVLGSWIYYKNSSDSKIYKIKTDGTGRAVIADEKTSHMVVSGGWIYYVNTEGDEKICRIKLDGTGKQTLFTKDIFFMTVQGDWVYYIENDSLRYLYKTKISDPSVTVRLNSNNTNMFNVTGDWVYYTNAPDYKMYKMKTDGTGVMKLNDIPSAAPNIVGEWIYYMHVINNSPIASPTYRMKLDGSQNQEIKVP